MSTPPPFDPSTEARRRLPTALRRVSATPPASVWEHLPDDLAALGCPANPEHVFSQLQRPWLWRDGVPAIGQKVTAFLAPHGSQVLPRIVERHASSDGATKVILELSDGERIEAVHMPRAVRSPRVTLCLSSQVGCALGCTFCATGKMGLRRHLSTGEIVGQVLALLHTLGPRHPQDVTLVFMGMGEPLHNVDAVTRALRVLCHPAGLHLSPSRITVSTAGLIPGIDRLAQATPRPLLALSLNATTDEARARTMPITGAYDLAALREALLRWPFHHSERVTLEYVLLAGENDSDDDADRLAAWATGLPHTINVIPFNEHDAPFRRPTAERIAAFTARLQAAGCFVTVRRSRGTDVRGACGQLARRADAPTTSST